MGPLDWMNAFDKLSIKYDFLKPLLTIDKHELSSNKWLHIWYKKIR